MTHPAKVSYLPEFQESFAQTVSLLSDRCTDGRMDGGSSVVFDIADMSGDLGERGTDGDLPRLTSSDTQPTMALREYGGTMRITDFHVFTSQSNEREKMYRKMTGRVNRRLDKVVIGELDNASTVWNGGTAIVMTPAILTDMLTELEQEEIPIDANDVTLLASPKVRHQLMKSPAYTSADYVSAKPYEGDAATYSNQRKVKRFLDTGLIFSPLLSGAGTASAKCFLFHRRAVGCAKPSSEVMLTTGFNDEHHYYFCSSSVKAAAKILLSGGIIEFLHDDTAA